MIQQELDKLEAWLRNGNTYNLGDALVMYASVSGGDIMHILLKLKERGMLAWRGGRLCPTQRCVDFVGRIYLAMTGEESDFSRFESLSQALWDNYPSMLQPSTGRPVRGSVGDVAMRLRILPPEYNIESYSDEDILAAEKRYLESLGGGYAFLLTLPDFIYQVKDGVVKSRLCDWLESDTKATSPKRQALLTL